MQRTFKIFWAMYLLDIVFSGGLKIVDYVLGTQLLVLFKIPLIISFANIVWHHFKHGFKWGFIGRLFLVAGIFAFIRGLLINHETIDEKVFSSIYTFLMPIFAVSFGIHYYDNYQHSFVKFTDKIFRIAFVLTVILLLAYFYFHYVTGQIAYFGFGTEMHIIGAYILWNKHILLFLFCIVMVMASGKRATTLNMILIALLYFKQIFNIRSKQFLILPFFLAIAGVMFYYAYENDYLRRFEDTVKFDPNDAQASYQATSGRWQEVSSAAKKINENPINWVIGCSIGAKYTYEDSFYGFKRTEEKHYLHFSPMGYIFIYGILFTLILYLYFIFLFFKGIKYHRNFYYLAFSVAIFAAFFGSNMFVDHKIWVLVGIAERMIRTNNYNEEINLT